MEILARWRKEEEEVIRNMRAVFDRGHNLYHYKAFNLFPTIQPDNNAPDNNAPDNNAPDNNAMNRKRPISPTSTSPCKRPTLVSGIFARTATIFSSHPKSALEENQDLPHYYLENEALQKSVHQSLGDIQKIVPDAGNARLTPYLARLTPHLTRVTEFTDGIIELLENLLSKMPEMKQIDAASGQITGFLPPYIYA